MKPPRILRPPWLLLLSGCTALVNALSLSDFSPRTEGLDAQCQEAYTTQIPNCQQSDFMLGGKCSTACVQGLVQINNLVASECQNVDVSETSIVGLFKMGQGIQVLCNVAVVTSTSVQRSVTGINTASQSASIGKSTMVLSSSARGTSSSLLLDSSRALSQTATASSQKSTSAQNTVGPAAQPSSSSKTTSSSTNKSTPTKTTSATADAQSVKGGNTNSGGGSPFDNINNSGAVSARTAWALSSLSGAVSFGVWLVLR